VFFQRNGLIRRAPCVFAGGTQLVEKTVGVDLLTQRRQS
jgi:hypothetical protein